MNVNRGMVVAAAAGLAVCCGVASADVLMYQAVLSGLGENPPNASPGSGLATLTIDTSTGAWTLHMDWSGLTAPAAAAHIHGPAPAGTNAGVLFPLAGPFGTTAGSSDTAGSMTATQMGNLASGLLYVNIHTSTFPGGELRDQLRLIPTPGAAALLGLSGLLATRRRR